MSTKCGRCGRETSTTYDFRVRGLEHAKYGLEGLRELDPPEEFKLYYANDHYISCEECWDDTIQCRWEELLKEDKADEQDVPIREMEKPLEAIDDAFLGRILKEYVGESQHGGWEGFKARDVLGISRMIRDLLYYVENYIEPTP
jgi:hypothetical protein